MYQALYRQYRPKTFHEVLGQKHITITLENQIKNNNISHAYLFSGTRGTGKTSTAKIFSRAVNCLDLKDGNPCNECEICKGILNGSIMDIMEMDAASHNSVDDIRDLREKVIYPPSRAKYKVYIIDEVHMLSRSAFNALLKTLEEPPKHLIFILATTEPEKLPQTILSRCQRFDFKRVSTKDIIENMKNISEKIGIQVDERVFNLIARNADGAMRDAISLLDQCVSFSGEKLEYEDAINILGITNSDLVLQLTDNLIEKDLEKALGEIDKIIQDGKDILQFIKDIIYHFRNLMIVKTSRNPRELIEVDEETMEGYLKQAKAINLNFILRSLEILTTAEEKAKWSTQPRIILEMGIIQIVKLDEEFSLEERIKRLEMGIRPKVQTIKTEESRGKIAKPAVEKEVFKDKKVEKNEDIKQEKAKREEKLIKKEKPLYKDADQTSEIGEGLDISKIENNWDEITNLIKSRNMRLYALLIEGSPLRYDNGLLTIGYKEPYGFHKEAINAPQNKEFVESILTEYFKRDIEINLVMGEKKSSSIVDEKKDNDDAIKEVIDFFGKDIVEIK